MLQNKIKIRPLKEKELVQFWQLAFSNPKAEWTKWNGPYFHDQLPSKETFLTTIGPNEWLRNPNRWIITFNHQIVGSLVAYFDDGQLKRWLEVGIVIYITPLWGQHIGTTALRLWLDHLFTEFTDLPHIGFTTWSGNKRMMALGNRAGMTLEGRIRQVRYWQGHYYDSIKYGILRSEWMLATHFH
ncbi:GNAT family N-acetyltransferase [Lentilactobacillus hilgardii]|uniref:GNAT family N-acetyltransferase n=1 Tax=Lentilactobacillus hilgardii TaxID=1588 RepID=UPI0021C3F57F|nr:GNAT family protein [Lentilactobacillus hilgardii]MCP9333248.1 GNAT family N-acetyltransferase [Lentilactobacillus hilgardii]MCP9349819.1 GNAT family N-acetyltransferase [Lentilactobacillus hilgardii]MCP9352785.1 GNAT family N-acetyltransferase [Lentilactobacillus hilgardii]